LEGSFTEAEKNGRHGLQYYRFYYTLTWGNGMLFNPMDLFNPFAPTDFVHKSPDSVFAWVTWYF
jgi:hypothetical protein